MRRETECMSELFNQRVLEASDARTHQNGVRAALIQVRRKQRGQC